MPHTVAENLTRLVNAKTAIGNAITAKGGTVGANDGLEEFAADIETIPSGGSADAVKFYDYDGTVLHSYSASEFANLTELPSNPTHEGLTSQGWNWALAAAKTYVADYGELNIGQVYNTSDGKTIWRCRICGYEYVGEEMPDDFICPIKFSGQIITQFLHIMHQFVIVNKSFLRKGQAGSSHHHILNLVQGLAY